MNPGEVDGGESDGRIAEEEDGDQGECGNEKDDRDAREERG